jgi:hypothetical protein
MDLKNYSKEQLETVLTSLLENGRIEEEDIVIEPTIVEKNAATMLHTLLCRLSHGTECSFYTNDKEVEVWIRKVRKFCELESQTPEDILLYISKIKEFGQGAEPYLVILSLFCMYHKGIWDAVQVIDSI